MNITVYPGPLKGQVRVPASKSMAHRFLIAAALADKPTVIEISALNDDITATMACLSALGARIEACGNLYTVIPAEKAPESCVLDCGESGSTLRFLLPVAAALGACARFTGRGRLPERPNAALTDAMRLHGTHIDSNLLPMELSGGMSPGLWTLPGNISSQYITGLMFALPLLDGDSEIRLTTRLESASYIEMTMRAVAQFGIRIERTPTGWRIPGRQKYTSPGNLETEGDWSAAAFWLAAGRMGSEVEVLGLDPDSLQGDKAVGNLLGCPLINAENTPDLVPALAACAAVQPFETTITGAARLRIKESDRLAAIAGMLERLGASVTVTEDGLIIRGGSNLRGGCTIDGMSDHRIVMAAAIAATAADGPVTILDSQAVNKSYPDFFRDFEKLGGRIHVQHDR